VEGGAFAGLHDAGRDQLFGERPHGGEELARGHRPASLSAVAFTSTMTRIALLLVSVLRSGRGGWRHGGRRGLHVHPHDLPDVTVRVLEGPAVHEAHVLGRGGVEAAAGGARLAIMPSTPARSVADTQSRTWLASRASGIRFGVKLAKRSCVRSMT
jgi:hypothetical protein